MANIRITQQRVETVAHNPDVAARITQHGIEDLEQPPNTQQMRCTQHVIEILYGIPSAYTDGGFTSGNYGY